MAELGSGRSLERNETLIFGGKYGTEEWSSRGSENQKIVREEGEGTGDGVAIKSFNGKIYTQPRSTTGQHATKDGGQGKDSANLTIQRTMDVNYKENAITGHGGDGKAYGGEGNNNIL